MDIFCDIDGVIRDFPSAFYGVFCNLYPELGLPEETFHSYEIFENIPDHTEQQMRERLPKMLEISLPYLGSKFFVFELMRIADNFHFITSNTGKNITITDRWLNHYRFKSPNDKLLSASPKWKINKRGILIDDNPDEITGWIENAGDAILLDRIWTHSTMDYKKIIKTLSAIKEL